MSALPGTWNTTAAAHGNARELLVTFGSASTAPFVANWIDNLRMLGTARLLVGALDDATFAACLDGNVPVVRVGAASASGLSSIGDGYFRKDYGRFKKMGVLKLIFLQELLDALALDAAVPGVWVCDADTVWLYPPPAAFVEQPGLSGANFPSHQTLPRHQTSASHQSTVHLLC